MRITRSEIKKMMKEELIKLQEALPPHLQKHFRKDGSSVRDPEFRIKDVTPPGYGPDDEGLSQEETPQLSNPPTREELDALKAGTILVGKKGGEVQSARKRDSDPQWGTRWDIFLESPEVVADPEKFVRGVSENVTNMAITGHMGARYTWEVYETLPAAL
jgi:hypothetical protein